ncbi:MAG: HDOD domain-containing protein [Syntrophobacteraceae bacterium]|nr:HDOD domain-containing protein [Syntrophobacteraceae bacterium]
MFQKGKTQNRVLPAIFSNLSDEEQIRLFNTGTVKTLAEKEPLFRKGASDKNIYWVLNGTLRVASRNSDWQAARFKAGDLVGETTLTGPIVRSSSVVAEDPSTVFCLSPEALDALGQQTSTAILKVLHDAAYGRLEFFKQQYESTRLRETALTKYVEKFRKPLKRYEQSEVITNIVNNIPRLPLHITHLIELLASEKVSAKEVAALAKQDPSLVVDILKTINSPRYNLPREITDVSYAITYLGFNEVYQLTLSRGLMKLIPDSNELRDVYLHSLFLSYVGAELCQSCDKSLAPLLSTIGLLHDLGKTVALLLRKQNPKWSLFIEMLDSSKLGAMLLSQWNIPNKVCQTIEYQAYPAFCPPAKIPSDQKTTIALLYVAHVACDHLSKGPAEPFEHPYLADYLHLLKFDHAAIADVAKACILPGLMAKFNLLPDFVRKLIAAARNGGAAN